MNEEKRDDQRTTLAADSLPSASGAWWRLPLLLVVVLIAIIAARTSHTRTRGPSSPAKLQPPPVGDAAGKTVSLTIHFGDGKERKFDNVAWRPGMTVDDLLAAASRMTDGIYYTVVGDHEQMLLTSINSDANERAAGRHWTYSVNDVPADRSLGIYELQPGDRVLWTFGKQQ